MGFCRLCKQHMESPYDCDCRCPECGEERWSCERNGCKETA